MCTPSFFATLPQFNISVFTAIVFRLFLVIFSLGDRTTLAEESVRPGINDSFLDPELDVSQYLGRFEIEKPGSLLRS